MTISHPVLPLSEAKARFSEVVRTVRKTGMPLMVTVDGEPAVAVIAIPNAATRLTTRQIATSRALEHAAVQLLETLEPFDAVQTLREGRR